MQDCGIPLDRVVDSLSDLKILKRCDSYKDALENIKDFDGVKHVIKNYSSFFDFRPLGYLIEIFGTDKNKEQFKRYEKDFEQYARRRLCECPSTIVTTTPSDHIKLHVKYEREFTQAKLVDIKQFQCRLSAVLKVPSHVLRLVSVDKGCIQLTFILPNSIIEDVLPLSADQKSAMVEMHVLKFSCRDYHLHFATEKVCVLVHKVCLNMDTSGTKDLVSRVRAKRGNPPHPSNFVGCIIHGMLSGQSTCS